MPHHANSGSFTKGFVPWNKKPKTEMVCPTCVTKFYLADWQVKKGQKYCSKVCADKLKVYKNLFEPGHSDLVPSESRGHSEETKKKITEQLRKNVKRGPEHPNWRNGATAERKVAMSRFEYRDWRSAVFDRDNYTCQSCDVRGGYVEADHIKPWCAYPELRYDVSNGRTLCRPCHLKQDTHGRGALNYLEVAQNG